MDAQAQLSRGDITNYKSVAEDVSNATIELERYKKEGYLVELSKEEVLRNMSHGTISRLALIVKEKPEGIKRRITIDLRRSGETQRRLSRRSWSSHDRRTPWTPFETCSTYGTKGGIEGQ